MNFLENYINLLLKENSKPLSPKEIKLLKSANIFLMDYELGEYNASPPPNDGASRNEPDKARALIKWFYENAPGDFS